MNKEKLQSEIAIFWNDIAENLPKSLERSALGDEKIFRAFCVTYPKIRKYLLLEHDRELWQKMEDVKEERPKSIFTQGDVAEFRDAMCVNEGIKRCQSLLDIDEEK